MLKRLFRDPLLALIAIGALNVNAAVSQTMPSPEQMMKVGECMASLDQSAMDNMQRKGEAFESDFKRLCKAGNRGAALQRAKEFGLEMASDPAMRQIKACTAGIKMPIKSYTVPDKKMTENDICKP